MPPRSELNKRYIFAILSVCLVGAAHHGYHMAALDMPHQLIKEWISKTENIKVEDIHYYWAVVISMFPFGCFIGSLFTNIKFGLQIVLFYVSFFTLAGQALMNMSREVQSVMMLYIGRLLLAMSAGFCAGVAPSYLWDISSEAWRKTTVIFFHFFLNFCIVFSHAIGLVFVTYNLGWIFIIMIPTIPTALGMFTIKLCPESPIYKLLTKQNEYSAIVSLVWFRNTPNINKYLEAIKKEQSLIKSTPEMTFKNVWSKNLFICLVVQISDQLCGFNLFIFYSSQIFEDFGLSGCLPQYATLAIGISLLLGTTLALSTVHYLKPKTLLLISLGFMSVFTSTLLGVQIYDMPMPDLSHTWMKFIGIVSVIMLGFGYGLGLGPVHCFIVMQCYNYSTRTLASAIVRPFKYLISTVTVPTFYLIDGTVRYYMLIIFITSDLMSFIFIYFYMPKTYEESDDLS